MSRCETGDGTQIQRHRHAEPAACDGDTGERDRDPICEGDGHVPDAHGQVRAEEGRPSVRDKLRHSPGLRCCHRVGETAGRGEQAGLDRRSAQQAHDDDRVVGEKPDPEYHGKTAVDDERRDALLCEQPDGGCQRGTRVVSAIRILSVGSVTGTRFVEPDVEYGRDGNGRREQDERLLPRQCHQHR